MLRIYEDAKKIEIRIVKGVQTYLSIDRKNRFYLQKNIFIIYIYIYNCIHI